MDWLENFTGFLARRPQAGIAGCRLEYPDGRPQHCGAYLRRHETDEMRDVWLCEHYLDDEGKGSGEREMPFVTGACMAMHSADFLAAGGFSPEYVIGNFEDLDLCQKMRRLGREVWYLPETRMIHACHQSFRELEEGKWLERLGLYNGIVFSRKWMKD